MMSTGTIRALQNTEHLIPERTQNPKWSPSEPMRKQPSLVFYKTSNKVSLDINLLPGGSVVKNPSAKYGSILGYRS